MLTRLRQLCCSLELVPARLTRALRENKGWESLGLGSNDQSKRLLWILRDALESGDNECCICLEPLELQGNPRITQCGHVMCFDCINQYLEV